MRLSANAERDICETHSLGPSAWLVSSLWLHAQFRCKQDTGAACCQLQEHGRHHSAEGG